MAFVDQWTGLDYCNAVYTCLQHNDSDEVEHSYLVMLKDAIGIAILQSGIRYATKYDMDIVAIFCKCLELIHIYMYIAG